MTTKQLQYWFDNLPFEDRFAVYRFVVKLYTMEDKYAKS